MRLFEGTITEVQFAPMVVILSHIDITVDVPALNTTIQVRGEGTIDELSERFGFIIISDNHWDMRPMYNRPCTIMLDNGVYSFSSYSD